MKLLGSLNVLQILNSAYATQIVKKIIGNYAPIFKLNNLNSHKNSEKKTYKKSCFLFFTIKKRFSPVAGNVQPFKIDLCGEEPVDVLHLVLRQVERLQVLQ